MELLDLGEMVSWIRLTERGPHTGQIDKLGLMIYYAEDNSVYETIVRAENLLHAFK
jgi:hypothetical protein